MSIIDDIKAQRSAGETRGGYIEECSGLTEVAAAFSLSSKASNYHAICKHEALEILTRIPHKDLAYNLKIMSRRRAAKLSASFLGGFDDANATFHTNISFETEGRKLASDGWACAEWKPVTDAVFDAGVIALSNHRCACLWVLDED